MESSFQSFLNRADDELHRAERYRIFISITVIDLGFVREMTGERGMGQLREAVGRMIRQQVRACDYVSDLPKDCFGLLFPETTRQGAEVALKRITEMVRDEVRRMTGNTIGKILPKGLASYPDTAGAATVSQFMEDLRRSARN
ncbi:MAG: GGDEF domain-containing protein [Candidatus Zixiibacteriota bacterium]|nr:MAG: GGDEF domain-containing protein [candidate division Zixibacteria bacterium]